MDYTTVKRVPLPATARTANAYDKPDLADAYEICLPPQAITDPLLLARFIFSQQGRWVTWLLSVRDTVVGVFGLKTAKQQLSMADSATEQRIYLFKIIEKHPHEILFGVDDKHLDVRFSLLVESRNLPVQNTTYLIMSSTVKCHNSLGRWYIKIIAPFHRAIVKSSLLRAARAGWPVVS
jgi:Protein of unknown function (DUF2867)